MVGPSSLFVLAGIVHPENLEYLSGWELSLLRNSRLLILVFCLCWQSPLWADR